MSYRYIIEPRAEEDIDSAADWYKRQRTELGEEFLEEIQSALDRASANPFGFQRVLREPEVRRVLTNRFPYRVFFTL